MAIPRRSPSPPPLCPHPKSCPPVRVVAGYTGKWSKQPEICHRACMRTSWGCSGLPQHKRQQGTRAMLARGAVRLRRHPVTPVPDAPKTPGPKRLGLLIHEQGQGTADGFRPYSAHLRSGGQDIAHATTYLSPKVLVGVLSDHNVEAKNGAKEGCLVETPGVAVLACSQLGHSDRTSCGGPDVGADFGGTTCGGQRSWPSWKEGVGAPCVVTHHHSPDRAQFGIGAPTLAALEKRGCGGSRRR